MATERNWHSAIILPRRMQNVKVDELEPDEVAFVDTNAFRVGTDYSLYLYGQAECKWSGRDSFYFPIRREITESFEVCMMRGLTLNPNHPLLNRNEMCKLEGRDEYYPVTRIAFNVEEFMNESP